MGAACRTARSRFTPDDIKQARADDHSMVNQFIPCAGTVTGTSTE